ARLIEHVRKAPGHARGEIAPGAADDDYASAGHVLTPVIAHALNHREGAAIAHRKALARDASEICLAARRPVENDVADEDVLLGGEGGFPRRVHDQLAARKSLADVVVGVALQRERHAARQKGAEALSCRAGEVDADRVVRQTGSAIAPRDLRAQDRADRT